MAHVHLDLGRDGEAAAGVGDHLQLLVGQGAAVDVGGIRTQEPPVVELPDRPRLAEGTRTDVDGDAYAELPGGIPGPLGRLHRRGELRPARRDGERDEPIVGREVLVLDPPDIGEVVDAVLLEPVEDRLSVTEELGIPSP